MRTDKNGVTLKPATRSDIPTLVEFRIIFLKEIQGPCSPEPEAVLRDSLKEYFTKSMMQGLFIAWIAWDDDKPVGFSGMVIREQPGTLALPGGRTGYILNMFTLAAYRKLGICSLLFGKLIAEAMKLNLDKVELHATREGEPVYRKFNFREPHDVALELILQ
ncbi:MAG: GNAT family N-acetyltransferase [Bacteroidota bacterium]